VITDVVIPALDEADALPLVLAAMPRELVRDVYVVDNGSSDDTARVAVAGGARLLRERRRGYGAACLCALRHLTALERPPDVVAFLDGDFSDDPRELARLLRPQEAHAAELCIGSRSRGAAERGSLRLGQRVGNRVAVMLIRLLYGQRYTDLGRFRAIRLPALVALGMTDTGSGWTAEMQVKAAKAGLRMLEVPAHYRRRAAGASKIAASLPGALGASCRIVYAILRHATLR
jgi:glycosyltransferase involved in cell wall biosynthesis